MHLFCCSYLSNVRYGLPCLGFLINSPSGFLLRGRLTLTAWHWGWLLLPPINTCLLLFSQSYGTNCLCCIVRFDKEGQPSQLAPVDFFVSTVDPAKEPPLVTANTILSILAVDYPVDKLSCYVSDDGSAMLTFESLSETAEFARKWVPFCKKHNIEPRAPEFYFQQKIDYLKDKIQPSFVKERRAMKVSYKPHG